MLMPGEYVEHWRILLLTIGLMDATHIFGHQGNDPSDTVGVGD